MQLYDKQDTYNVENTYTLSCGESPLMCRLNCVFYSVLTLAGGAACYLCMQRVIQAACLMRVFEVFPLILMKLVAGN